MDPEQLVVRRHYGLVTAKVTLPTSAAEELSIDAARLVELGKYDVQPPAFGHTGTEADNRPASRRWWRP